MKKYTHWKLLADLNISIKTVEFLKTTGCDIVRIDKSVSTDEEVVEIAKKENRIILTFDKDFGEIYYFATEKTMSAIVLSLADQRAEYVNSVLKKFFERVESPVVEKKLFIVCEFHYRCIG